MANLIVILAFVFGAAIGSFLNVVMLRLPRGEKLTGRSRCPHCGRNLKASQLVPLLSFLVLAGKCGACRAKISPRYFIIELLTGLLFAAAAAYFYPGSPLGVLLLLKSWLTISLMILVFVIDLEHFLIFDSLLLSGGIGVLLLTVAIDFAAVPPVVVWQSNTIWALINAVVCPIPFFLIWYFSAGRWLGFGDVKLAAFLGLALGWPLAWVAILLGIFLGGLTGMGLLAAGKKTLKSQVPFGSFLSLAAVTSLFWGGWLLRWYLSLLGLGR